MIFMKVFIISSLDIYHFGTIFYMLLLLSSNKYKWSKREFIKKTTNSQINLSEAWEHFFKNDKAHRAQKDISEVLEQVHGSKNLSEA